MRTRKLLVTAVAAALVSPALPAGPATAADAAPTVSVTGPEVASAYASFTLTADAQGSDGLTYAWTGDPACWLWPADGAEVSVSCSEPSPAASFTVTVSQVDGQSATATVTVRIRQAAPSAYFYGSTIVHAGEPSVVQSMVGNADQPTYAWTDTRGWVTGDRTDASVTLNPPTADVGQTSDLTLTVTNADGQSASHTMSFLAYAPFPATITGATSTVSGSTEALTVVTARENVTVSWYAESYECTLTPTTDRGADLSCPDSFSGDVTVHAYLYDQDTYDSKTVTHTVAVSAPLRVTIAGGGPATAGKGGVTLTAVDASSTPAVSWAWSANRNCLPGARDARTVAVQCLGDVTGPVTVTLTAASEDGQHTVETTTVEVAAPTVAPTVTLTGPATPVKAGTPTGLTVGANLAGAGFRATVTLQSSTNGTTWTPVGAAATTSAAGALTLTVTPTVSTRYRVLVATAAGPVASAPVTVVVPVATRTTLTATPGNPAVLRARVVDAKTGGPVAGARVTVTVKRYGATQWTTIGTYTTDAQGVATVRYSTDRAGYYQATYAGSAVLAGSSATTALVKAVPKAAVSATRSGSTVTVTARLTAGSGAAVAATSVTVQYRAYGSNTWRTVKTLSTSATGSAVVKHSARSKTSYRVVFGGSTTLSAVASAVVTR
ncbi:hypothetical protein GCM10009682_14140 [Luedemannella flava]|uniref:Uncharacterized protein n=1 Tax=Luedemannella flava TaxID=349316 RepID=A0ABP4XSZ5_9ACTN